MPLWPGIILLTCFLVNPELKKGILWQRNVYIVVIVAMVTVVRVLMVTTNMVMGVNAYIVVVLAQVIVQKVHTKGTKNNTISILTSGRIL